MTLPQLHAQLRAAIMLDIIERWRNVHRRAPAPRIRARMEELLRSASVKSGRLKVASASEIDAQISAVFSHGLPGLDVARELEPASPRTVEKVCSKLGLVGDAPAFRKALEVAACFSRTSAPALILGETGTGKDLVARFIHDVSPRSDGPFITMNCAAVTDSLLVAELFGYDPGAFTGAAPRGRVGKAEAAHGGTLFLDEIGELSPAAQAALLRFVDTGEVQKVGRVRPQRVDVRLIAATNRDLQAMVKAGSFRADLFYRIALLPVDLPPLRARKRDLPLLIEHFLHQLAREHHHRGNTVVSAPALKELIARPWPGNVRELKHTLARAFLLAEGQTIGIGHLTRTDQPSAVHSFSPPADQALRAALQKIRLPLFRALDEWVQFLATGNGAEFSNRDVTSAFNCSDSAARIRLAALVTHGILVARGSKKGRRYRLADQLAKA